ncbi:MAG: TolC family protein [Bacteroidota bacterium]|nr:TolC family protein [Bacteroidota bacterium]
MTKIPLILLFSTLLVVTAFSQEKLTLKQSLDIALEKNIDVIRSKNTVQSQDANVTAAYGNFLPSLNASANMGRSATYYPATFFSPAGSSANNSVGASLNASVTLFDGFRNTSTFSKAGAASNAARYDFEKKKQDIVLAVQQAYLTVLRNEQLVKVNEDNLKSSQQQLSRISESNKVGAVAKADVYRQQVQTANDELSLISAQSNFDNSKLDLLYLLSLDVTKGYVFEDSTVSVEVDNLKFDSLQSENSDYDKLVGEALQARPDYQSSILAKSVAQSNLTIARAGHLPSLSASAGYGYSGTDFSNVSDTRTWNWRLSLSIPLFSGFQVSTLVQTSQLDLELADQSLEQTKRKVAKDLRTALLFLETARKRYDVAKQSVVSAEEDRRIAQERYNLGSNTLLDLLVATSNFTKAQSDKVNAVYDYLYAKQQFKVAIGKEKY